MWPAALSAIVFAVTSVQGYLGNDETLYLHVPRALVLTVGSTRLLMWSFCGSLAA